MSALNHYVSTREDVLESQGFQSSSVSGEKGRNDFEETKCEQTL